MKVLIKSPFSIFSGYGQDGYGIARALLRWGCDVYLQPQWLDVPVPLDLVPLLTKTLQGPFDLTINHWDPAHLNLRVEAREMTRAAVAWTMWEFSPAPHDVTMVHRKTGKPYLAKAKSGLVPHCEGRNNLRDRLAFYDLVLGYDHVTMSSLDPWIPPHVARAILQGGYDSEDWKFEERDWFTEDQFMFGMHGALNNRKQAWGTVQAYVALCHENAEFKRCTKLAFHTTTPGLFPELNEIYEKDNVRLKVFMAAWSHEVLQGFYRNCHVLLCPSRGEGKNLPALEHMTTGGVVAATNYGGHQMWLNEAYAYPLDYELTPTFPNRPDAAHDAKVDVEEIKRIMLHTWQNRTECKEKGTLAAEIIPKMCDWNVVVSALFDRIRDNCPHNGELIWNMAQEARRANAERPHPVSPRHRQEIHHMPQF